MILGLTTSTFTLLHVLISLVGIASGLVVMYGFLTSKRFNVWTAVFLAATVLTSVSGFGFPFTHLSPGHIIGFLSLVMLTIAIIGRYGLQLRGAGRWIYVVSASVALYFNVFVLVVQSFEKVPALKALAPTQKEPPFAIAQLLVLGLFVVLTIFAVKRFDRWSSTGAATLVDSSRKGIKRVA